MIIETNYEKEYATTDSEMHYNHPFLQNILQNEKEDGDKLTSKIDIAYFFCDSEKYCDAARILKETIKVIEDNPVTDHKMLAKVYLSYSNCLFSLHDYVRSYYYLKQFLNLHGNQVL